MISRNIIVYVLSFFITFTMMGITIAPSVFAEEYSSEYTIVSEDVPQFDTTPIRYENFGFLYLENGSYGFIKSDNSVLVDSGKYHSLRYQPTHSASACLFPDSGRLTGGEDNVDVNKQLKVTVDNNDKNEKKDAQSVASELAASSLEKKEVDMCSGIGFGTGPQQWLGTDYRVYSKNPGSDPTVLESSQYSLILPMSNDSEGEDVSSLDVYPEYYIVSKDLNYIYGPYNSSEIPTFTVLSFNKTPANNPYYDSICLYYGITSNNNYGLFYEKSGQGYIIHSADGMNSSSYIYDYAKPISDSAMQVKRNGQMGIVNIALQETYMGTFEDCTELINGKGYVKVNGKWLYVQFNNADSPLKSSNYSAGTYVCDYDVIQHNRMLDNPYDTQVIKAGETVEITEIRSGLFDSVWGLYDQHYWVCIEDENGVYLHKL